MSTRNFCLVSPAERRAVGEEEDVVVVMVAEEREEDGEMIYDEIMKERHAMQQLEERMGEVMRQRKRILGKNTDEIHKEVSPYLRLNTSLYSDSKVAAKSLFDREFGAKKSHDDITYDVVPEHCIPIRTDVRQLDWHALASMVQFDVILMDPPWQLAGSNPTRGVTLGYKQMPDRQIEAMPIELLQRDGGLLFIWVINAKYAKTLRLIRRWGYRYVDDISWVKSTNRRRMAKGHGHYLQHAKEHCLVAMKGNPQLNRNMCLSDVIFAERRGQSQKPEQLYEHIETLVPNGRYLEIFARKNNLRNYWMSIGIEL